MKIRQEKGITLVALIITIIVLLILAMVSINLVMNGGIIDKSKNAVDKYSEEEVAEQIKLAYQEYQMSQYTGTPLTLQQAMDKAFGTGIATVSGDATNGWTVIISGMAYPLSANGTVGAPTEVVITAWTKIDDETYTNGVQSLKIGDYVNYDPTAGATEAQMTYTSYAEANAAANKNEGRTSGYDSDQSFDARTYKSAGYRWRVLDVKDGKIRLISEEYVGPGSYTDQSRTQYYLQGQKGYINGIAELNAISSIFGHGTGAESATSITEEDINEITGHNPATANPKFRAGHWDEYGNKVTYTLENGEDFSATSTNGLTSSYAQTTFKYYNGTNFVDLTGSVEITNTYYYRSCDDDASKPGVLNSDGTLSAPYEILFGKYKYDASNNYNRTFTGTREDGYWLASSYVRTTDGQFYWNDVSWGIRIVFGRRSFW